MRTSFWIHCFETSRSNRFFSEPHILKKEKLHGATASLMHICYSHHANSQISKKDSLKRQNTAKTCKESLTFENSNKSLEINTDIDRKYKRAVIFASTEAFWTILILFCSFILILRFVVFSLIDRKVFLKDIF